MKKTGARALTTAAFLLLSRLPFAGVALALDPPTDLWPDFYEKDSTMQSVLVTWDLYTGDADSICIERKTGGTEEWAEIARVAAGDTSYIDSHLVAGTYNYRLRASAASQYSDYTAPMSITIIGIPWVRVTRPAEGEQVKSGSTYTIQWESNRIDKVLIDLSTDDGLTWTNLNPGGSLDADGAWDWDVPDTLETSAIITVHEYQGTTGGYSKTFLITANPQAVLPRAAIIHRNIRLAVTYGVLRIQNAENVPFALRLLTASGAGAADLNGKACASQKMNIAAGQYIVEGIIGNMPVRSILYVPQR